ncbi:hypothetical protein [Methylopila sp. 73B]|uniref:hypothetical protein n=1 Tax=Methylopila sp. 73B TaxID=1120792 RepID=UPI0003752656|nr:hypothetical protein [Methylopila sp. 73B]
MTRPAGFLAVMAGRRSPPKALDFFPTPPWATRAFVEFVLAPSLEFTGWEPRDLCGWDPCCGEGHMVETLKETLGSCRGSDVFDYGTGYEVADALEPGAFDRPSDLIVTNPPFNIAAGIVLAALTSSFAPQRFGVFVLVRSQWFGGGTRFRKLFSRFPPTIHAPYVERVPMVAGRYNPKKSTATDYCWLGWTKSRGRLSDPVTFIPPCRKRLELSRDILRWCPPADAPLFDGAVA